MATAAPSPLASSPKKTNGAKLSRLLIDGGTTVLRNVFEHHHPSANLAADIRANYPKLNKLLKKKVLHKPQWDKLFPPGGAAPDSNTFDITLLFLLLTNMCGLSPPPSGWHAKPLSSDTSLEANLARIKFFRNELYGHVASTDVDTPTFSSLWQEISVVLVSLGFDQAEIDRLKAEHCDEEDYLSLLLDWADSEENIKSQLKDIRQSQTQTEEKLKHVHQIQEEERRMQLEDHETLLHTRQAVEEMQQKQQERHREIEEVLKEKESRKEDKEDKVIKKLAVVENQKVIRNHAGKYQEGTRESIFEKVMVWLDDRTSEHRVMVISGNAGMGKSVIAAVVCQKVHQVERLSGSHFCQHNKARYRNPNVMLQSLASQLCDSLPEYKKVLVKKLSGNLGVEINNLEVGELFELLFEEPLSTLDDPGRNLLMVIDGLDESDNQGRNELLDVIANYFSILPVWMRFCFTTRPELNIADRLKKFKPLQLEPDDDENLKDIRLFFEKQLNDVVPAGYQKVVMNELARKAEGLFLYAYLLVDFIKNNISILTPEKLDRASLSSISSVYQSYFERLEKDMAINEEQLLIFLSALAAAREPLPLGFVSKILLSGPRSLADQRKVKKAVSCISALLPAQDGCICFFHKSVKDWLIDTSLYGQHDFTVNENKGHLVLSQLCIDELDDVKRNGVNSTEFSDTTKYALQHGVQHMLQMDDKSRPRTLSEELVNKYVTDLELIYAKLVVSYTSCLEEFSNVKEYVKILMSVESQVALNSLLRLLRKHSYALGETPHLFFQCLLNDGEPELSSKAAAILETELPNITYMKYMDNELQDNKGAVQERFYCSDTVVCFDVSPEMDHMVCECRDETIHLWSLKTGTKVWVRPSLVEKNFDTFFFPFGSAYRGVDRCLSCYRSVVFHPSGNFVLPGSLKDVYSLSGDRKCLFANSRCSFSDCTFSGDKERLLTNSPKNSKEIVLWDTGDGHELNRIMWSNDISGFAISQDGSLIAFSDFAGAVCMVDAPNCAKFKVLIKNAGAVCGLMHFTSDSHILFCGFLYLSFYDAPFFENKAKFLIIYLTNPEEQETQLYDLFLWPSLSSGTTESEFHMQRQPSCWFKNIRNAIPNLSVGFYLMLYDNRALISSPALRFVSLVNVGVLHEGQEMQEDAIPSSEVFKEIMFSHKDDIIYFIGKTDLRQMETAAASFRMSTQEKIKIKTVTEGSVTPSYGLRFATVPFMPTKEGVVLFVNEKIPELWNFELTEFVRPFTELKGVMRLSPVSGELVAYHHWNRSVESPVTVHIVNILSGNLVSSVKTTAPCDLFTIRSITCNGKQQVLISTCEEDTNPIDILNITITLWNNDSSISWKRHSGWFSFPKDDLMFSPQDEFVVTWNCLDGGKGVHILDAKTGETLHRFLW